MSLYNCPNCIFPKISLYSNPSMDLPHNPTLCQRVNNARDISQNMTSAGKTDWSQINVGGPYLPSFAQSQQYALGVAKGLSENTNQVPQNTLITPNNTIPTSGAYTQYAYEIAKGAQQTANNQVGGSRKRFSKKNKNKSKKNKKTNRSKKNKNKIGGMAIELPADQGYIIYKPDGNHSEMKKQKIIFGKDEKGKYIRIPGWVVGDYKRYIKSLTRDSQRGVPGSYKGNPVPALYIVTEDKYTYIFVPDDRDVDGIIGFLDGKKKGGQKKSQKRFSKRVNKKRR